MSTTMQRAAPASARRDGILASFSRHMVDFAERYFPDAYVFVLLAVLVVAAGVVMHGGAPLAVSRAFGDGFWNLIPFTMQMALVAISGYVVAMSPPVAARYAGSRGCQRPGAAPWCS
jgi:short-chain fatty acids transporter